MKVKILLFFASILMLHNGLSNNPGFLGRRFIVGYEFGLNHPILQGVSGKIPSFYNTLKFEYTVSRIGSIGVSYMFHIYNNYPITKENFFKGDVNGISYYNSFLYSDDYKGNLNFHAISFYGKIYKSSRYGHISPIGYYVKPGIGFLIASDKFISRVANNGVYSNFLPKNVHVTSYLPFIKFGIGRDFVFLKRMTLDVGLDLNVTIPNFAESDSYSKYSDKPYLKMAYENVFYRNLFNIHVGIGFLAF